MSSNTQKWKNRYRLLGLLVIFPIYKTFDFFLDDEMEDHLVWGFAMLIVSIAFLLSLAVLIYKRNQ
ncbi:hypothetical protein NEF87_001186 [Candidatus Lokiarchaeum ossiferum]|uniref:Uncharacterized protein n=1 Tax=Candidatus Lokiarchaeum ossiferum TaxID=2951803 RepID=A0ABY6HN97_9ARCH|nr:hypothetical protein NEF87_001186 [Candidatus Lokiarchaeum sp. B-35]